MSASAHDHCVGTARPGARPFHCAILHNARVASVPSLHQRPHSQCAEVACTLNVFVCTPAGIACLGLACADKENWVGTGATPLATALAAAVQRTPFSGVVPAPRSGTQKGGLSAGRLACRVHTSCRDSHVPAGSASFPGTLFDVAAPSRCHIHWWTFSIIIVFATASSPHPHGCRKITQWVKVRDPGGACTATHSRPPSRFFHFPQICFISISSTRALGIPKRKIVDLFHGVGPANIPTTLHVVFIASAP